MRFALAVLAVLSISLAVALAAPDHSLAGGDQVQTSHQNGILQLTTSTTAGNGTPSGQMLSNISLRVPAGFATDIGSFINSLLTAVLAIASLLVLLFLIRAGLEWITSGGDKGKTEAARGKLINAVVGLIIVAASYAILILLLNFLGFSDLNDVFRNLGTIRGGQARMLEVEEPADSPAAPPATQSANNE
ncbi:MAG: hypothetical protein COU69_04660 [Candidatus Pacebacteria bacterium CG10_big_fil_rev_8_21_14_0_10_56_10]|nr:MAG: hypothetical protein COU69_04660 [Candidatus Pacebacteria bacterium CG10_big_fil_rev_8_21_14_0_10_56_10]